MLQLLREGNGVLLAQGIHIAAQVVREVDGRGLGKLRILGTHHRDGGQGIVEEMRLDLADHDRDARLIQLLLHLLVADRLLVLGAQVEHQPHELIDQRDDDAEVIEKDIRDAQVVVRDVKNDGERERDPGNQEEVRPAVVLGLEEQQRRHDDGAERGIAEEPGRGGDHVGGIGELQHQADDDSGKHHHRKDVDDRAVDAAVEVRLEVEEHRDDEKVVCHDVEYHADHRVGDPRRHEAADVVNGHKDRPEKAQRAEGEVFVVDPAEDEARDREEEHAEEAHQREQEHQRQKAVEKAAVDDVGRAAVDVQAAREPLLRQVVGRPDHEVDVLLAVDLRLRALEPRPDLVDVVAGGVLGAEVVAQTLGKARLLPVSVLRDGSLIVVGRQIARDIAAVLVCDDIPDVARGDGDRVVNIAVLVQLALCDQDGEALLHIGIAAQRLHIAAVDGVFSLDEQSQLHLVERLKVKEGAQHQRDDQQQPRKAQHGGGQLFAAQEFLHFHRSFRG